MKKSGAISRARVLLVTMVPIISPNMDALQVMQMAPPTYEFTSREVAIGRRVESSDVVDDENEKGSEEGDEGQFDGQFGGEVGQDVIETRVVLLGKRLSFLRDWLAHRPAGSSGSRR